MSIIHKSAIKGFKSVDTYMIAMARCIATYLCYLHARKGKTIFYEHLLRVPIIEIAQSYKWDYKAEYVLRGKVPKRGAHKKIDYAFAYNNQVVGLEIKFPSAKNLTLKMQEDVKKLKDLFTAQEAIAQFPHKYGYVMVVYDEKIQDKIKGNRGWRVTPLKDEDVTRGKFYRKRNILSVNGRTFETACTVGNCCYCVNVQKILEQHGARNEKCDGCTMDPKNLEDSSCAADQ